MTQLTLFPAFVLPLNQSDFTAYHVECRADRIELGVFEVPMPDFGEGIITDVDIICVQALSREEAEHFASYCLESHAAMSHGLAHWDNEWLEDDD